MTLQWLSCACGEQLGVIWHGHTLYHHAPLLSVTRLLFSRGAGVYPMGAMLNHSCVPNCYLSYEPGTHAQVIRTAVPVQAGQELTHPYADVATSVHDRQESLAQDYFFVCQCPRCERGLARATRSPADIADCRAYPTRVMGQIQQLGELAVPACWRHVEDAKSWARAGAASDERASMRLVVWERAASSPAMLQRMLVAALGKDQPRSWPLPALPTGDTALDELAADCMASKAAVVEACRLLHPLHLDRMAAMATAASSCLMQGDVHEAALWHGALLAVYAVLYSNSLPTADWTACTGRVAELITVADQLSARAVKLAASPASAAPGPSPASLLSRLAQPVALALADSSRSHGEAVSSPGDAAGVGPDLAALLDEPAADETGCTACEALLVYLANLVHVPARNGWAVTRHPIIGVKAAALAELAAHCEWPTAASVWKGISVDVLG